ncbi:MAG: 16S rRNA (uracil(1498)-N(3))-methyltransferase [Saprospiraceae bacterium]|nr:16S rRNA (uracil(1498)-N(3))-methyltransferase [Saprospiraceae bacterium]
MHYFYSTQIIGDQIILTDQEWQHLAKSLRMQLGDELWVLDGKGTRYRCKLDQISKREARADIEEQWSEPIPAGRLHLAIAPTKNMGRIEWLLEKATEMGLWKMSFIVTNRTERNRINFERLEKIAISALKQSGNLFLPRIQDVQKFSCFVEDQAESTQKFIAHCQSDDLPYIGDLVPSGVDVTILIGPEGDFTVEEVELSKRRGYKEISLGGRRLRTETAGIFVTSMIGILNRY